MMMMMMIIILIIMMMILMMMIPVLIREHMVSTKTWPISRSGNGSSVTFIASIDDDNIGYGDGIDDDDDIPFGAVNSTIYLDVDNVDDDDGLVLVEVNVNGTLTSSSSRE